MIREEGIAVLGLIVLSMLFGSLFFWAGHYKATTEQAATQNAGKSLLDSHMDDGHAWVIFGDGGRYHHPDCPCKTTE